MSARTWRDDTELPERTTWLLEASAGTGKTYQIAGLFVRLVAEHGVAVERILAITFTTAATAELRDRIRGRLRDALAAVRAAAPTHDDPVIAGLLRFDRDRRALAASRLELALRSFDVAPISTIHGFSQRMLQEFAFDSGQDPDLELLADPAAVVEQIVDDSLATLYAQASAEELDVLVAAGVGRAWLLRVAKSMSGASEPGVVPSVPAGAGVLDGLLATREWASKVRAMNDRWTSAEGDKALEALRSDVAAGFFNGNVIRADRLISSVRDVKKWLKACAPAIRLTPPGKGEVRTTEENGVRRLRSTTLKAGWTGQLAVGTRSWLPFADEFDKFCESHETFWTTFAPLAAFAVGVRARVEGEVARRRLLTFDSMLSRLAERVVSEGGAKSPIASRIRERYDAAFVDEFQDTDSAQWTVIEAAFHGHRRLFLIGDPKQAIYGFRGADVHVYLEAAGAVSPAQHRTMATNWRSDPRAVAAMNRLWRGESDAFDQKPIDYVNVEAMKADRLAPIGPGLEVRWVDARAKGGAEGEPLSSKETRLVARLAAREAHAWLDQRRASILASEGGRPIAPGDIAVLVNGHHEAREVRRALARMQIPAVSASKDSVFDTPVAEWLASWLDAVAAGGRDREARTAVVTPLFGWRADELAWALAIADGGDEARAEAEAAGVVVRDWNGWTGRLRRALERWWIGGFARTLDRELTDNDVYQRLLAMPEGERHATDLRHLFELLHVEERARRTVPRLLAEWLRAQANSSEENAKQRLESDAHAVKIETVHASKGLEYPIVLLPFAWAARPERDDGAPLLVRCDHGAELNVEPKWSDGRSKAVEAHRLDERREALRKLYVALTRARHRTVAWYGPIGSDGKATSATALGRVLMRNPEANGFDDAAMPDFTKSESRAWPVAQARLSSLVARSDGAVAWVAETALDGTSPPWRPQDASRSAVAQGAVWPGDRGSIAGPWLVTSYTGLSGASAATDWNEKLTGDAPPALEDSANRASAYRTKEPFTLTRPPVDASLAVPSRLSLGRGREYGTWFHSVLEQLDFTTGEAKDGRSRRALIESAGARVGFGDARDKIDELEQTLPLILATPLDSNLDGQDTDGVRGLLAGTTLRQITVANRLDELTFDLRLGDGTAFRRDPAARGVDRDSLDSRVGCVDPRKVYDAIFAAAATRTGPESPWLAYQRNRLDAGSPLIGSIVGILTGSIDLLFRAPDPATKADRYFLVDYKTNTIGDSLGGHYTSRWLDWEMASAGYPLQALIYTLALHRHLKQRLRKYDYDTHVGGYFYLFVRGMTGAETPRDSATGRCLGVFGDRWSKQVIEGLDEALCPGTEACR